MANTYIHSGYITYRNRKITIEWSGQNAEHVMNEWQDMPSLHPFTHVRIQQLTAKVKEWKKQGKNRHVGTVTDRKTGITVTIIADIYNNFALPITAILKSSK